MIWKGGNSVLWPLYDEAVFEEEGEEEKRKRKTTVEYQVKGVLTGARDKEKERKG